MNVEMITALEQIKSSLGIAYKSAERRLRDPFSDPVSISNYLLTRLHVVSQDIDDIIKDEEDALEDYYQEYVRHEANGSKGLEKGFNPLIHSCASEISSALGNCWVAVRASRQNEEKPEYIVTIQPDNHNTPNDIQLQLRSLGYSTTFRKVKALEHSNWADFAVEANGIRFNLSSTVSEISPPELDRHDEPATDEELPF